jgi:hypothetical protein
MFMTTTTRIPIATPFPFVGAGPVGLSIVRFCYAPCNSTPQVYNIYDAGAAATLQKAYIVVY